MFYNKMKKLPFVMLTLLVLASCNNNSSIAPSSSSSRPSTSSSETNDERYAIYVKAQAAGFTGTYQEWLNSIKGADGTSLLNGTTNPTSSQGKNGDTYINTSTWDVYVKSGGNWTKVGNILGTKGADGLTPHIGNNGNWWIGTTDTNVPATGPSGTTPHIGNNGNWWIGTTDTGVSASASVSNIKYTVTFKPENGQPNFTQQVNQYHLVTKPTNPTKADHQFTGWFTDLDEQWVFSGYPLTQNLTLTAKYQVVENGTDGLMFTPTIYEGKQSYVVSGYEGTSKDVIIPATFNDAKVVGIASIAFIEKAIESIVLSGNIRTIGNYAFSVNQLTSVAIPNGVTHIGNNAFYGNQLTSVTLPSSLVSIGNSVFSDNQLTSISIPNNVTSIGDYAFSNNLLTTLNLPNSLTTIGESAFSSNQLSSVTIPNSITSIERYAFAYNQLTSVTVPNSVISIGEYAFQNNQLTSVTIPNSVTTIGNSAFQNNQLTSVTIPNSVTAIGTSAFSANQLTYVYIPNSVLSMGSGVFIQENEATIYVEHPNKPEGWFISWVFIYNGSSHTVVWGYTGN